MSPNVGVTIFIFTFILVILIIVYQIRLWNTEQKLKTWSGDYDFLKKWSKISKIP